MHAYYLERIFLTSTYEKDAFRVNILVSMYCDVMTLSADDKFPGFSDVRN